MDFAPPSRRRGRRHRDSSGLAPEPWPACQILGALLKIVVVNGSQFLVTPQISIDQATVTIPRKTRKQVLRELAAAVAELRQEAKAKGLDKLSMREINATVAAARRARLTRGDFMEVKSE